METRRTTTVHLQQWPATDASKRSKIGQAYNDAFSASSNPWFSDFLSQKCHFEVVFEARLLRVWGKPKVFKMKHLC